jgi:signal transduction histidine kinase
MMPDGRGINLLETIEQIDPETVAVIITGYATVELAIEAIKSGAYDFISKPFDSEVLLMTVNQGLEKRNLSLERKRLLEVEKRVADLARAKAEMERLNEFKSQFLLVMAHELRSPIGGAQSLLRTMLRGLAGELTDQQKEILNRIESRMDFMLDLINDLFTLAESQQVKPTEELRRVAIQPVMSQVIDRFSDQAAGKKINLSLSMPEDQVYVLALEEGLDRMFSNLVGNAVKYTPQAGKVNVKVECQDGLVMVEVADNGIGIPEEAMAHIWEEFYRAPNAKQAGIIGTGLGLNIVHQYVEQFGAQIKVESQEGKGTTFQIIFSIAA